MGTNPADKARWHRAVADTIRAERAAAELTQAEAAERAAMPRISYIRYESGERHPDMAQIAAIASAFGIPLGVFVRRIVDRVEQG